LLRLDFSPFSQCRMMPSGFALLHVARYAPDFFLILLPFAIHVPMSLVVALGQVTMPHEMKNDNL